MAMNLTNDFFTYEMKGWKELNQVLKDLPQEIRKKVIDKSMRKGGEFLRDKIREKAPVGTLEVRKNNIRTNKNKVLKFIKLVNEINVVSGGVENNLRLFRITTGKAYWGMFYEFGTKKQQKRPFMRPVFDENKEQVTRITFEELTKGVIDTAQKLAKL